MKENSKKKVPITTAWKSHKADNTAWVRCDFSVRLVVRDNTLNSQRTHAELAAIYDFHTPVIGTSILNFLSTILQIYNMGPRAFIGGFRNDIL